METNREWRQKMNRFWTQSILSRHLAKVKFTHGRDMSNLLTWTKTQIYILLFAKLQSSGPLLIIYQTSRLVCVFVIHC